MADFDDLFEQPQEAPSAPKQPFDKEAWGKQKQAQREEVYALAEKTAQGLTDPAAFRQYLAVQGQFPLYSVNNALLPYGTATNPRYLHGYALVCGRRYSGLL